MTRALLLTATPLEADFLQERLSSDGLSGPNGSHHLVVAGMGAVNTAHGLTHAFLTHGVPDLVIQAGVGGAYVPGGLQVGELAIATEEVYGDVGVITPDGWLSAEEIGIPLIRAASTASAAGASSAASSATAVNAATGNPPRPALFNHIPLDAALAARAAARTGARTGRFLTLAQVTGVRALGDALYARHHAICESMEGAAAAHVCALYAVPFLEIRGISNLVEDRDRSRWRLRDASLAAQRAALQVLEHLAEVLS